MNKRRGWLKTVNEDVIDRHLNEKGTETYQDTLLEVIYECPYGTSPVVMEDFVNEWLDYSNQKGLIE